jgi:hypothetical protein
MSDDRATELKGEFISSTHFEHSLMLAVPQHGSLLVTRMCVSLGSEPWKPASSGTSFRVAIALRVSITTKLAANCRRSTQPFSRRTGYVSQTLPGFYTDDSPIQVKGYKQVDV